MFSSIWSLAVQRNSHDKTSETSDEFFHIWCRAKRAHDSERAPNSNPNGRQFKDMVFASVAKVMDTFLKQKHKPVLKMGPNHEAPLIGSFSPLTGNGSRPFVRSNRLA